MEAESRRHAEAEAQWKDQQLAWKELEAALKAEVEQLRVSPASSSVPLAAPISTGAPGGGQLKAEVRRLSERQRHVDSEAGAEVPLLPLCSP
jgi:hypothetical protein